MLDANTKHRIDNARDILVGKVPDPKSQVEQITIALIYKFMDDMDAESEEFGGHRKFFAGEFARYGWAKLMRSGLGGHEVLNLYAEAITKMQENPNIPLLFRNIFKNAYLPYRDPETLRAFLKTIDEFSYDHSEKLGDSFEYLLSVLGSQGDAGQFRTPRHIIDFIVSIIDPKKDETILDPACGTAGFLISSYKHIQKTNIDSKDHSTLTPDDKTRLAQNLKGYDISPDMVRLSLANMYLHGFTDPHIYEYDTLTSQERWNEYADVILANPPFMSPKGGIKPHNRFSVNSKRSEVLFVDYMAEHLTPNGRAGIIVPEGIIFQSQTAYKQLRKMLVEDYLVAVISLPAGVFNPYSGVKTSILILDKSLVKRSNTIGFFKVENDGYGLGAQRRPIDKNDLPQVLEDISEYLGRVRTGDSTAEFKPSMGLVVERAKVAANGEYNLSVERYRGNSIRSSHFPIVSLGDVALVTSGQSPPGESYNGKGEGTPFYQGKKEFGKVIIDPPVKWTTNPQRFADEGDILMSVRAPVGPVNLTEKRVCIGRGLAAIKPNSKHLNGMYAFYILKNMEHSIVGDTGAAFDSINRADIQKLKIPLPSLEIQKDIVAEIKSYQKVIDGAQAVVDNYRPHIPIHPDWPVKQLAEVATKITDGTHKTPNYTDSGIPFLRVTDITQSNTSKKFISEKEHRELIKRCHPQMGDILYSKNGTIGVAKLVDWDWEFSIFVSLALIKPRENLINPYYLACFLNSDSAYSQATARSKSGTVTNLHLVDIKTMLIPLPPLATQQAIVAEIEAEQELVNCTRELIVRFEKKIQATLSRVWGEEEMEG